MKPLPDVVLRLLDTLPEGQPQKIVLNTDGHGHWEVEVFSRYRLDEERPALPLVPMREKAVRMVRASKKRC